MKPLVILNDVHLGVQRVAGTTPASAAALQDDLQFKFGHFINQHQDKDLCILGDLYDGFLIDYNTLLVSYLTLSKWLTSSGSKLLLVAGNHDIGKRNDRLSSFDVLAQLLANQFYDQVEVIREGLYTHAGNIHIIPHCMNQDLFDIELEKARTAEPGYLLLHANVDNGFAEHSDHSLNVDAEWLTRLSKKHTLLFAHEHQNRKVTYDHKAIFVLGNQWPSSVADCLAHGEAQKNGIKFAHVIHDDGLEPIQTWERNGDFVQMDWTDLSLDEKARFIRITGKASAEQASDVVSAISRFRQKSEALVIVNGVAIDGVAGVDELSEVTLESVKSFNVLEALLEVLNEREQKTVKELLA